MMIIILWIVFLILVLVALIFLVRFIFALVEEHDEGPRKSKKEVEHHKKLILSLLKEAKCTQNVIIAEYFYNAHVVNDLCHYVSGCFKVNKKEYWFKRKWQYEMVKVAFHNHNIGIKEHLNLQLK